LVLAFGLLAGLGDWRRGPNPDKLRATFVLACPPDRLRANVRGDEPGFSCSTMVEASDHLTA
jgi:hypothetical protein